MTAASNPVRWTSKFVVATLLPRVESIGESCLRSIAGCEKPRGFPLSQGGRTEERSFAFVTGYDAAVDQRVVNRAGVETGGFHP